MFYRIREFLLGYPEAFLRRIRIESVYTQFILGVFGGGFLLLSLYLGIDYIKGLKHNEISGTDNILIEATDQVVYIVHPLPVNVTGLDRVVKYWLYRTPLVVLPDGTLIGDLLSAWEVSSDGRVFTFYMVDNATWSDGNKITADDIIFTMESIREGFPELPMGKMFKDLEILKIDDYRFQVKLKQPYAPFLEYMTFPVMSKQYYSRYTVDQLIYEGKLIQPVTSGGYIIDELTPQQVVLKRIYNSQRNRYLRVIFKQYHNQLWKSLIAGEAFGTDSIDQNTYERLKQLPFLTRKRFVKKYNFIGLFFNLNSKNIWIREPKFRQWLYTALDRDRLSQLGLGVPAYSVYPESSIYYHSELVKRFVYAKVEFDRLYTNILSKNECYQKGGGVKPECTRLELKIRKRAVDKLIAQPIKDLLEKYDLYLTIKEVSDEEFNSTVLPFRDFDMLILEIESSVDPDQYLFWHSSQKEYPGLNISGLSSRRMDRVLLRGRVSLNREERKKLYFQMQEILFEFMPFIPILQPYYDYVFRNDHIEFQDGDTIIFPEHRYLYLRLKE